MKKSLSLLLILIFLLIGCSAPDTIKADTEAIETTENTESTIEETEAESETTESIWESSFLQTFTSCRDNDDYDTTDIVEFNQIIYDNNDITIQLNSLEFKYLFSSNEKDFTKLEGVQGIKLHFDIQNNSDEAIVIKNTLSLNGYPLYEEILNDCDYPYSYNHSNFYIDAHENKTMFYRIVSSDYNLPVGRPECAYAYLAESQGNMLTELGLDISIYDYETGNCLDFDNASLSLKYDMNNLPKAVETDYRKNISDICYTIYEDDICSIEFYGYLVYVGYGGNLITLLNIENKTDDTLTISYGDIIYNDKNIICKGIASDAQTLKPGMSDILWFETYDCDNQTIDTDELFSLYGCSDSGILHNLESVSMKLWIQQAEQSEINRIIIDTPVSFEELWKKTNTMPGTGYAIYK